MVSSRFILALFPAELTKLTIIIFLGGYLSENKYAKNLKDGGGQKN
jgi:hypothetical protein